MAGKGKFYLNEQFAVLWGGHDLFETVENLQGEVYRAVAARKTMRFSLEGKFYFLKLHRGVGWLEIAKNLLYLRLPVLSAENEWRAINRLHQAGIDTMTAVAYGRRGLNPATRESFIVTEALENTVSLEDFCANWRDETPDYRLKRQLITRVAQISRIMHESGINHRDFYICHFLMDRESVEEPRLHLIDLHRAQIRDRVPSRWRIKDVAGLFYSALAVGLTSRDLVRFITIYGGKSMRRSLEVDARFWRQIRDKAVRMYLDDGHPVPANLRSFLYGR